MVQKSDHKPHPIDGVFKDSMGTKTQIGDTN